jgi:membrane-bound lytic murein transglycosylase C
MAIIRQESAFNPRARSHIPAFGLMQIVPKFAGREVLSVVAKKSVQPDSDFLYDPKRNIMLGTTYLQLLRDQYFPKIAEPMRSYLMTASYNWGPHRIQKAIKTKRLSVTDDAKSVFQRLQEIAPQETQEYLRKVTQYRKEFEGLQ